MGAFPQLTAEEEEKRKLRRERNKVAASKCRMKRKMQVKSLTKVRSCEMAFSQDVFLAILRGRVAGNLFHWKVSNNAN